MEKTTKKRRSKKGLRKRIGIIAIGGMSVVLTVCLSVGATLAWFAGSTWASKSLYMGGPVYVEMAGRGLAGTTATPGTNDASWQGGEGALDIEAAASRSTGTVLGGTVNPDKDDKNQPITTANDDILLPGQKVQIYSQARVFSTAETTTIEDGETDNISSGANTTNTSNGVAKYRSESGRVTTTTTSVLRARFSIEVQFDPGMGFNNFTDSSYRAGYPVQSGAYKGDGASNPTTGDAWSAALGKSWSDTDVTYDASTGKTTYTGTGRRDGVAQPTGDNPVLWSDDTDNTAGDLTKVRAGTMKSIYQWKYVSASIYNSLASTNDGSKGMIQMGSPFDGKTGEIGYYGVWITDPTTKAILESDAFYKARCNAYLKTYKEYYVNEYGNTVTRTVADSIDALEKELNAQFVKLVNDSSDAIHTGYVNGFTVSDDGQMTGRDGKTLVPTTASWLYIDPSIGNDTNTDEISTSVGGWWYLVADDGKGVGSTGAGENAIHTATDSITAGVPRGDDGKRPTGENKEYDSSFNYSTKNTVTDSYASSGTATLKRSTTEPKDGKEAHSQRLNARLFEIKPNQAISDDGGIVTINDALKGTDQNVRKTVSVAFPFVNGSFALPSDALSNLFSNAKITFKVAFQALQAFFPYTTTIDKVDYKDAIMGTAKALNIANAIPIFNEAFDYQEKTAADDGTVL